MTDTTPATLLVGDTDYDGGIIAHYIDTEAAAVRFYATSVPSATTVVSCDACMTGVYVTDHGNVCAFVPHISTESFTGCLPCFVGAVAYGDQTLLPSDHRQGAGKHRAA